MKNPVIRRLRIIWLAFSFVLDYRKISQLERKSTGQILEREVDRISRRAGQRMRRTAFQLQGVIVKVGQFLSMRQDLLPAAFVSELQDLQDNMPAAPFRIIKPLLERSLAKTLVEVFLNVDEDAIAAASLAQVHKATLINGDSVAVKILRPNIERFVKIDLNTLRLVAKVAHRIPSIRAKMNFIELHREFTETVSREVNCKKEKDQLIRFQQLFKNDSRIHVPRIYDEFTSERLLVMEYIDGVKITDVNAWTTWGIKQSDIVQTLLDSYLKQALSFGFVHLDPHPGNLLILADGRICFLDFGMVGLYNSHELENFRALLQAIMMRQAESVVSALTGLGYIRESADIQSFTAKVDQLLKTVQISDARESGPRLGEAVKTIRSLVIDSPIQMQAKYMFLIRTTGILITVLREVAPRANWPELLMDHVLPIMMAPIAAGEQP